MCLTNGKKIAITGFCIFLAFMAVCTVIAKGIYRSGLPRITVQVPYSSSFVHEMKASGIVKQGQEYGIFVESGLRVSAVAVRNGEYFEMGAPLFQIHAEDLQDIIEERELEINKLKSIQKENLQTENHRKQEQQTAVTRAKEDYDNVSKEAEAQIEKCRQALEAARQELALYDEYLNHLSQTDSNVSGGDADSEVYAQQYDQQEKRNQLVQNVASRSQELENAERQKDINMQTASRAIEDAADDGLTFHSTYESIDLDVAFKEKKLLELKELMEAGGWIYSESAGRIIECRIAVGQRTQDAASIVYALDNGEKIVEATFKEGSGSYLALNAELTLKANLSGGNRINDAVILDYLKELENGDILAEMSIENLDINIGQTVELSYRVQTDIYTTCISSLCIHSDERGGDYVYIAEKREGILGTEWKVRKVYVTILDQTDTMTAIESAEIGAETKVVVTYTDDLVNGDAVRVVGAKNSLWVNPALFL